MPKRGFVRLRVMVLALYSGILFFATLGPVSDLPGWTIPGADKLVHIALFGGLVPVLYVNLPTVDRGRWTVCVSLSLALAGIVELVQIPLPHRNGDVLDLVAGFVGAVCAGVLSPVALTWSRRRVTGRRSVT